ncbi:MAG: hypothetical protein HRU38_07300 [Saccharospirillaceae bacterium]|nr:hypothetical protein [Pseudomonadales bacterium]NRB78460.1 hypothetical protein [Saccharospirillaceae bacterium]
MKIIICLMFVLFFVSNNAISKQIHQHQPLDVGHLLNIPSVQLVLKKDEMAGWNLHIQTQNFTFTPENINQANRHNQGHAHLYINGVKATRLYGQWFYLSNFSKGQYNIKVSLNSNDHQQLMLLDEEISAEIILSVPLSEKF